MSAHDVVTQDAADRAARSEGSDADAAGADAVTATAPVARRPRSDAAADRFMRRLLRVGEIAPTKRQVDAAQGAFRASLIVSGIRCLIMYLAVPIIVPIAGLAEWFAAPIGIALCLVAFVTGVYSLRRFWVSDHRYRWMYTGFIAFVFAVLAVSIVADMARLGGAL